LGTLLRRLRQLTDCRQGWFGEMHRFLFQLVLMAFGCWLVALQAASGMAAAAKAELSLSQAQQLAGRMIGKKKDAAGWGKDVWSALRDNGITARQSNFCAALAVIEQESTYTANPVVNGLGRIAEDAILEKLKALPVLPGAASAGVEWFLRNRPTPEKSYRKLIRSARTERDLDLVFRNMVFFLFKEYATTAILNAPPIARRIDAINPVTTIGSMQVSVGYAVSETEKSLKRRLKLSEIWHVRDELYTRKGGVAYGIRMLLGYRAGYPSRLHVFADFNAGRYASRNAAFQYMVSSLGGQTLARDGDLLIYDTGKPRAQQSGTEKAINRLGLKLSPEDIRADLLLEKDFTFRDTETYSRVSARYARKTGKAAPYAMVPQIKLESPKLSRSMTTERFARAVLARYERCMKFG
jgi:hypothetical protein